MSILTGFGQQTLSSGELAALAGPIGVQRFMSIVRPTDDNIGTAVTGTPVVSGNSFYQLPYTSGTGVFSSAPVTPKDATIWIGSTPGGNDIGIFRLRTPLLGSPLNIMQISYGDAGMIPTITTLTGLGGALAPGQYLTAKASRNMWQAFPRIVTSPSTQFFKDWDRTWSNDTIAPPPIVNVTITDLSGNYAGGHASRFVDPGQSYATFTLTACPIIWPNTTSSALSYTWTPPSGASLVSGSLTGSLTNLTYGGTITVRFPVGFQYVLLQVLSTNTSSADNLTWAQRYIWVHDGTPFAPGPTYPPVSIAQTTNDQRDSVGRTIGVTLYTQDAAGLEDGAFVNVWDVPHYANGGSVPSMITSCIGWISTSKFTTAGGLMQADLTIKNPGAFVQAIISKSQRVDIATTPANWQQVVPALGTVEYFVWYMLRYQLTFLLLFDFWPYQNPIGNTYLGVGITGNAGNEMGQLIEIAKKGTLMAGCDSAGSVWLKRDPAMELLPNRGYLVQRGGLDLSMATSVDWTRNWQQTVGSVQGEGFKYTGAIDPTSGQNIPVPLLARSPGDLTGQGLSEQRLESQLVDSAATLEILTGLYYAMLNNPYPLLDVELPFYYNVLEPAQQQLLDLTIPAKYAPTNLGFAPTTINWNNWIPQRVTLSYEDGGNVTTKIEARWQTYGPSGVAIPVPNPIIVPGGGVTPTNWHAHIDFTLTNAGFTAVFSVSGAWSGGTGWSSGNFHAGTDDYTGVSIALSLSSSTTITSMSLAGSLTIGGGDGYLHDGECGLTYNGGNLQYYLGNQLSSGSISKTWTDPSAQAVVSSPQTAMSIGLFLFSFDSSVGGSGGSSTITTCDVYGTGTIPTELLPYIVP